MVLFYRTRFVIYIVNCKELYTIIHNTITVKNSIQLLTTSKDDRKEPYAIIYNK